MRVRRSNFYGIYRVDHDASQTHSWLVTLQRRGRIYHRHFSDRVHGGKRKALEAATAYRDRLASELPPLTRQELCAIRKKNNRSGVSGVTRIDVQETRRGHLHRRAYWDVQWPIGNGKARHKKFSVTKYGEQQAFQLALKARQAALQALSGTLPGRARRRNPHARGSSEPTLMSGLPIASVNRRVHVEMEAMMTRLLIQAILATLLFTQTSPIHATNLQPPEAQNTGLVTGLQGGVAVHPAHHPDEQTVRAGERLHVADEIYVRPDGRVDVLWNRRAVFSLKGGSRMRLLEPIGRQTRVELLGGSGRFAYSYNEGHPADTLAIVMSEALVIMRGGIVEVESETLGHVIRVVEGQASIETPFSPGQQVLLKVGQGMQIRAGTLNTPHPSTAAIPHSLAAMDSHRQIPSSTLQGLAQRHVQHALELEERLRHATDEDNPHEESKGAILSTSLGLPPVSFAASSGPGIAGSLNPGSLPPLMSPAISLPTPVSPAPSASNMGTLGPIQAGGINSASLLQNTLKNVLTVR